MSASLVGSEMCIRDRAFPPPHRVDDTERLAREAGDARVEHVRAHARTHVAADQAMGSAGLGG
eukprot:3371352-Alexandrium_andersonii.AAC.1